MKFIRQLDEMDCGPTCLKMVLESYNQNVSINKLRQLCGMGKNPDVGYNKNAKLIFKSTQFRPNKGKVWETDFDITNYIEE